MQKSEKLILLTNALAKVKDDFKPKKWFDLSIDNWRVEKGYEKPFITRRNLRALIGTTLSLSDAHTINNWIPILIGKGFLQYNPHTKGKINPSNNTRYYITVTPLRETNSYPKQTTLLTF